LRLKQGVLSGALQNHGQELNGRVEEGLHSPSVMRVHAELGAREAKVAAS